MSFLLLKALHVIAVVSWFSGLFYLGRLFVYHREAADRPAQERKVLQEQLEIMQRRLWYFITMPAMIATVVLGLWLATTADYVRMLWFHAKMILVIGLLTYHFFCGFLRKLQLGGKTPFSSKTLRILNEVPTLFLVMIVILAFTKTIMSALWGLVGVLCLGLFIMLGIRLYKRKFC